MTEPTPSRPATYADLEALPDDVTGELIDGVLYVSPKPAGPHILAASTLGAILLNAFQLGARGPGGWWILQEPECHFPLYKKEPNVLQPDIAAWRKERLPRVPRNHIFDVPPDWVCEVLSPDKKSRKKDLQVKP